MNKSKLLGRKIAASLIFLALLTLISSASASLVMTGAYQQSATSFTPTWTVAPSLISGMSPTAQAGNFTGEGNTPGVSALTDGAIGPVSSSANNIYAAGGPSGSAGSSVTYTLPVQSNGYNLTNITVYSGWANGGRIGQGYTVLYSTVANPGNFIWLTNVSYAAGFTGNSPGNPISIQVQLSDSAGGVIASNVAAIQFDFTSPTAPADENGGTGYSEITVQGTPAPSVATPPVSITTSNENGTSPFAPTWTAETPDLIAGLLPSSSAGNFNNDGGETVGLPVLTDGSVGVAGTKSTMVSCGANAGTSLVYQLTNSVNGSDVTNIVVYSMWGDAGRFGQYYTLSYSSVLAPATFIPITTVFYLPHGVSGAQANRVAIFNPTGAPLAQNVSSLKFDFASPPGASSFNNGWQGYSEIVVQGTNSQPLPAVGVGPITLSPYPLVAPGTTVTASVAVIGPTPYYYQWRTDGGGGGALTNIPGATTSSNLMINTTGFAVGNYQYALFVSNNISSATSSVAVLTIQQPNGIPGVIGVKFGFTGGYATSDAPFPADNAGVASGQPVPPSYQPLTAVANWNNLLANLPAGGSTGGAGGTRAAAINQTWNIAQDSAGNALSNVTLTPNGFDDGWYSGGTECANGRLLYDFWKFDTANGLTGAITWPYNYVTLTFSNLPNSTYDVYVYVNDNNGNYWGNVEANGVFAVGNSFDLTPYGFNGDDTDPCNDNPPLHTAAGFGHPANYVKMPYVATAGGTITITNVFDDRAGNFGVSAVELVPSQDIVLVQDTLPTFAETVIGDQVAFTAAYSNSPSLNLQWLQISGGVTNNVNTGVVNVTNNGVITSTLTLANAQTSNAGYYWLKAVNATNSADYSLSSAAQLVVGSVPSATNGVSIFEDAQTGQNFYPPLWSIQTNIDLIWGFVNGGGTPGTFVAGPGSYSVGGCVGDPTILSDGILGDTKATMVSCGPNDGAGISITYYLQTNSSPLGFEVTNIQVYGGWTDAGRRNQDYEVSYSTFSSPTNYISLGVVDYVPADPSGAPIATRTILLPATGVLAHNAISVQINWSPFDLNGFSGYSEIAIYGTNSTTVYTPVLPTITSIKVSGGNLNVSGTGGTHYANYTWLGTADLTPPVNWVPITQGVLDGAGSLSSSLSITNTQMFFMLRMP